tara:strand:- start:305 stop:478 length:174 start_codon:yes stop_codon:yes gene_type:complete
MRKKRHVYAFGNNRNKLNPWELNLGFSQFEMRDYPRNAIKRTKKSIPVRKIFGEVIK